MCSTFVPFDSLDPHSSKYRDATGNSKGCNLQYNLSHITDTEMTRHTYTWRISQQQLTTHESY